MSTVRRVKLNDLEFATAVMDFYAECTLQNKKFTAEGLAEKTGMKVLSVVSRCDKSKKNGWNIPEFSKSPRIDKRMSAAEFNRLMDEKVRAINDAINAACQETEETEESEELELA